MKPTNFTLAFKSIKALDTLYKSAILIGAGYGGYKLFKAYKWLNKNMSTDLIDPTSKENLAYQSAGKLTEMITDGKENDVGTYIYRNKNGNPIAWVFDKIAKIRGDL